MSFWRREVIDFALDYETLHHMEEQSAWIAREPSNPRPYYHLAQLYRLQGKQDEGRILLLEAVRLDADFAAAHAALAEIYAVSEEYGAAWHHARLAERNGEPRAVELLERYGGANTPRGPIIEE